MSEASSRISPRLRPALWLLVFTGPALRTSLLGALLVAEEAIGKAFGLSAGALAILVESVIFGGLLAVFLVPPLIAVVGLRRVSFYVSLATVLGLVAAMGVAPFTSDSTQAIALLFVVAMLLGFCVAIPSPITQTLLNNSTTTDKTSRQSLQSVWSAGQPAGFIVASVVGGLLIEPFGWWTALVVPLAFALVSAISQLGHTAMDVPGQGTAAPRPAAAEVAWIVVALVAFEIWSTWGSLRSWMEPGVLAALAVMVVVTIGAISHLRHSPRPAVSLAPFSVAGFAAATVILLIYQFPTTAEFEVLLLTELGRMSAEDIGTRTAIGNVAQIAGTAFGAVLLFRRQIGLAFVAGFTLTIAGLAGYVLYLWWDGFVFASVTRAIVGLGGGVLTPVLFVVALARIPASLHVAAGTWLVLATIGGTEIGLALFDIVLEVATGFTGSARGGYLSVEATQLLVGMATALLTAWLAARGRLFLTPSVIVADHLARKA